MWDRFIPYVRLARPDNWFKNVFLVPGFVFALQLTGQRLDSMVRPLLLGLIATCLVASANYVMNEWADRDFDCFHPFKNKRPSVVGRAVFAGVVIEYLLLAATGLALSLAISAAFTWTNALLLLMGFLYNVRPFRTKDRTYLDVLSESVNNPIRLLLGWFIVTTQVLPPSSLVISYWMGGAFLMGVKRYSEFRAIGPAAAARYRRSFQYYTEENLLISSVFYAILSATLGGVFMVKYRIELILIVPFIALMFAWYLAIGLKPNSAAQHPENMRDEKLFLAYVGFVSVLFLLFATVRIPEMAVLLDNAFVVLPWP